LTTPARLGLTSTVSLKPVPGQPASAGFDMNTTVKTGINIKAKAHANVTLTSLDNLI
jgi:hypothetical protein